MAQKRRKFSPQYKAEAVAFVLETGRPITEVAADLGIHAGTLGKRVAAWHESNPEPEKALTPMERAEVAEMEDELRKLRLEYEFQKKRRPSLPRLRP